MVIHVSYSNNIKNKFTSFDEITNTKDILEIHCYWNKLTSLPENMNFPNLKLFNCDKCK